MANSTWQRPEFNKLALTLIVLALIVLGYFVFQQVFAYNEAERCAEGQGVPGASRGVCVDPVTGEVIN